MEPIFPLLIILLIIVLSVDCTVQYFRVRHWRGMFESQRAIYDSTLENALDAERECGRLTQEYGYLKETFQTTIAMLSGRQTVAVMTDAQVQLISNTLASLVTAQGKNPSQLN
jgi:hypothetical protein